MAKITAYVVSCSNDSDLNITRLYLWGEFPPATWLPITEKEAKRRIKKCKEYNKCEICDAQIHEIKIKRTDIIYKNLFTKQCRNELKKKKGLERKAEWDRIKEKTLWNETMKQKKLAEKLGVHQATISQIETNRIFPTQTIIKNIKILLKVK